MLYVVRHGQTAANAAGLIQGRSDRGLTDLGRSQAAALAAALPAGAAVISSPLLRARQTAEAIGRYTVDERWIELDFGALEGVPIAEARLTIWPAWQEDPEWAPAGGESLAAVQRRVAAACDELLPRIAGTGDVVVVAHVSPIKAAVAWALGVGPLVSGRMFVDLASITTVAVNPSGVPVLRSYNLQPPE